METATENVIVLQLGTVACPELFVPYLFLRGISELKKC